MDTMEEYMKNKNSKKKKNKANSSDSIMTKRKYFVCNNTCDHEKETPYCNDCTVRIMLICVNCLISNHTVILSKKFNQMLCPECRIELWDEN